MPYPSDCPDITLSDVHQLRFIIEALRGWQFSSEDEQVKQSTCILTKKAVSSRWVSGLVSFDLFSFNKKKSNLFKFDFLNFLFIFVHKASKKTSKAVKNSF